eukprot:8024110-Pyramimonas_sp.AAC.1
MCSAWAPRRGATSRRRWASRRCCRGEGLHRGAQAPSFLVPLARLQSPSARHEHRGEERGHRSV